MKYRVSKLVTLSQTFSFSNSTRFAAPRLSRQRWLSPLALILLWELGARTCVIPAHVLAAPSTVTLTAALGALVKPPAVSVTVRE